MKLPTVFTTSWDDGSVHDLRLAEILAKYGVKGTFYIPLRNSERDHDILSSGDILRISKSFEVGGHTFSHVVLTMLSDRNAESEIKEGKKALEDIIGCGLESFCFPRGKFKQKHVRMAIDSGFKYARTAGYIRIFSPIDKIKGLMHPTLQFYPHSACTYIKSAIKRNDFESAGNILMNINKLSEWEKFAHGLLDKCLESGGVFHLWGHSWEIEKHALWDDLERFIGDVSKHKNVVFCSNKELWEMYESI
jgi:peptidoglycan/xylan/chitin deacetylase (PgdA/CDA1 family)